MPLLSAGSRSADVEVTEAKGQTVPDDRADESTGRTGENDDDQVARRLSHRLGYRCLCEVSLEGKNADPIGRRVTEMELLEE